MLREIINLLLDIEEGKVKPERITEDLSHYHIEYKCKDIVLTIFNDCGDFEYIESIEFPNGIILRFPYNNNTLWNFVTNYQPVNLYVWGEPFC